MKNQEPTAHSPKNTFIAQINYNRPLSEIGSSSRVGAMTLEGAKHEAKFYTNQAKKNNTGCTVVIKENKKTYPDFDWVEVETYKVE